MKRIRLEVCPQKRVDAALTLRPWKVTKASQTWAQCRTQADAIALAVVLAHQMADKGEWSELVIKRPNGEIRDSRTYPRSSDPRTSRG